MQTQTLKDYQAQVNGHSIKEKNNISFSSIDSFKKFYWSLYLMHLLVIVGGAFKAGNITSALVLFYECWHRDEKESPIPAC